MVGEFYFLGEQERIRNLDAVLEEVNGRLPVVFGCSGVSVPQVLLFARAAQQAGADAIIAMAPARTDAAVAMDMFRRLAEVFDGPIVLQNAATYAPLTGEQIATLVEEVPTIEYIKEERHPVPRHIAEVHASGWRPGQDDLWRRWRAELLPDEMRRGADGCMPACEWPTFWRSVMELWWAGDEAGARESAPPPPAADYPRDSPVHALHAQAARRLYLDGRTRGRRRGRARCRRQARDLNPLKAIEGDITTYPFGPE